MASKMQPPSASFPAEEEKGARQRKQKLSEDDVTNQGRLLLSDFIHQRMVRDGVNEAPSVDDLQEPGTLSGPRLDHFKEITRTLQSIADELDGHQKLQALIKTVPPEAKREAIYSVALRIFDDGVVSWGRVVALFYFACKVCTKVLHRTPLMRAIINFIIDFIHDRVAHWIVERGGWEAILEYSRTNWKKIAIVAGAVVVVAAAIYFVRRR